MHNAAADALFWTRMSRKYAQSQIKDKEGYERTLSRTGDFLSPGDRVLEFGCGTGTTALRLADRVASIAATDIAEGMIAIAQEKAVATGVDNVDFFASDLENPFLENSSFDHVLAFNVLHLLWDLDGSLRRIHALLRPGGCLISKSFCLGEASILIRAAVPLARLLGKAPHVGVFTAEQLRQAVANAGFEVLAMERHGSGKRDHRIFIVARKPAGAAAETSQAGGESK